MDTCISGVPMVTTPEGREMENLLSLLGLSQLISEPTNFEPNKSLPVSVLS